MSLAQFQRARLVPFAADGRDTEERRAIPLDFNPETLTLKVSGGEARDRARRGRQQVQNVGASKATLSFECYFDSTRPRDGQDGEGGGEEMLDVRLRTKPIADLLQVSGSGREQAPRRVQFRWGTLIFNGIVTAHQEVFDYFSPSGVPLRSKVQLTLTEQEFRYQVDAADAARRREATTQAAADARSSATTAGADSLLGGGPDIDLATGLQLSVDLSLDADLSVQLGLSASLGVSADVGLAAGAGITLDASAAVDVFGPAALGGSADLGRSGLAFPGSSPGLAVAGVTPNPWAPDGPAPGSSAAALAALINNQRAGGAVTPSPVAASPVAGATRTPTRTAAASTSARPPLPVRGSPPLALRRTPPTGAPLLAGGEVPRALAGGERRPRWESLPAIAATAARRHCACGGRGCGCCGGDR
jgi:hypothetical protein